MRDILTTIDSDKDREELSLTHPHPPPSKFVPLLFQQIYSVVSVKNCSLNSIKLYACVLSVCRSILYQVTVLLREDEDVK